MIKLDDWKFFFIIASIVSILGLTIPFVISFVPKHEDGFLSVAILSNDNESFQYYTGEEPVINIEEEVDWIIQVENHMGEIQYVSLRVKMANSTDESPDIDACEPLLSPVIFQLQKIVLNNENWIIPFSWIVNRYNDSNNNYQLSINDHYSDVYISLEDELSARFIFELWVYDVKNDDFLFTYKSGDEYRCVWNQMWFRINDND